MTQTAETTGMQETTRDIAQARQCFDAALKAMANGPDQGDRPSTAWMRPTSWTTRTKR